MGGSRGSSADGPGVVFSNIEPNFPLLLCWTMSDETGLAYTGLAEVPALIQNQRWLKR